MYSNNFVSRNHAELMFSGDKIFVRDMESANSTYVNNKAIRKQALNIGDVVNIMGLQIISLERYLFINNPDGNVHINCEYLQEYHGSGAGFLPYNDNSDEDFEDPLEDYYYRAPRFKHTTDTFELRIDTPPSNSNNDEMPMIMLIGPSMTMGMASVATGTFAVTNAIGRGNISSAIPSIVMSLSMLCGTLLWPLVTRSYQRRQKRVREAKRQETYTKYLSRIREQIEKEIARQEKVLRENDVDTATYISRIICPTPQIWERTLKHTDFLSLRLGYGNLPLNANIEYAVRRFTVENDNLTEMMYELGEQKHWLNDVPVCLPLREHFISGIYSTKRKIFEYAKSLIIQIVALHSYDEVKLALLYDESDASEFEFVRWLPHVMNNERTIRYIATNSDEIKELSATLDGIIEYRKSVSEGDISEEIPYIVIICLDKDLAIKTECVRRIQEHKECLNISVLSMFERLQDLPKECTAVVELREDNAGALTIIGDVSEPPIPIKTDAPRNIDTARVVDVISNTFVDVSGSMFTLPKKYTFFEMLDLGVVEHLNIFDNWAANDPTKSLSANIGIDRYGEAFKLDLHEKAHGPHGLVAGTTGSGKSEFLITYILSMAISYHPYEVAFILIDYKGGGMAKSFENIPHTAGVITNLDGNGIKRSLASMRSELHRRERIFRDTSQQHGVSNIDIYKYQKLYREKKVSEPLPHLFIISDEFAELKKEQSEFMTELTTTARVGRSLGVHLILATQKPDGVVDEQIRSNSRFRICFKVQDSGDSKSMLGRPEAVTLVDTGRFYMQIGYNELFEIGQSAWAGAPYYPSSKVIRDRDDALSVINTNGQVIAEINTDRFAMYKDPKKQLDVITDYIVKTCNDEHIVRWKMWLDPIPENIYIDALEAKYGNNSDDRFVLNPIFGEYDDPEHQRQGVMCLPLTYGGNAIIYGSAGNGKAMFIEALCYSLIKRHTPREVNIYILDFGAETLTAFADAPHVGDVILSYEQEKIENLFKLLIGKLETRKRLLSKFGGNMLQYNEQAEKPEPSIVVIINNYASFSEICEEKLAEMSYLTREGVKYGVYFVLACTGVSNVRFNLLQNFKNLYCLQLNNTDEYASVVGKTGGMLPDKYKGRGLYRFDKDSLFEFQVAGITQQDSPYKFIREFTSQSARTHSGANAAKVPVLPENVDFSFVAPYIGKGDLSNVPIGVERESLHIAYYDFAARPVHLVLSANDEWRRFTNALTRLISEKLDIKMLLLSPNASSGELKSANTRTYSRVNELAEAAREIFALVLKRHKATKSARESGGAQPEFEPYVIMIESMALAAAALKQYTPAPDEQKESDDDTVLMRLQSAIEHCDAAFNIFFIIGESLSALSPLTVEGWYKAQAAGTGNGIWVGGGANTQYRITVNSKPKGFADELTPEFGFSIKNAAATLVKFVR